ncbi:MAG: saccharopine dehydrogenase NADP-binding domain-containing protein [Aquimonas sp.]|nr:saccharopine dehydrogenase NADP-binding domain-containing protein [Aquimonas sp.]
MSLRWMLYGANGYTGRLMAEAAVARGLRPLLAGRNAEALKALAEPLGLEWKAIDLADGEALREGLREIDAVMHCAGPFSATCTPMLEACLASGTHYLDITGEIDVFAHCQLQDARAKQAGVLVLPGAGFDVVPTDCLAAQLKRDLPDATHLVLAFEAGGGPSPGTAKTSVEGLGKGGRVRENGELKRVPLAYKVRYFEREGEQRSAMTIPWGDVCTAYFSTGIPNIEVYMAVSPATINRLRRLRLLGPLLGLKPVQQFLKRQVERRVRGPSDTSRERSATWVWGEATNAAGQRVAKRLRTSNGYTLTVDAALGIIERLSEGEVPAGFHTASQLMGADYIERLPGVSKPG